MKARSETGLATEIVDADIDLVRLPREPFLAAENLKWVQSIGVEFKTVLYDEMIESDVVIPNTASAFDTAMAKHALANVARGPIINEPDLV